uniref:AAA+ ATPase domain-containing protein n=1 Tax=Strigamia maritima TaxID=126957 RepID=T1JJ68_STRMM
HVIHFRREFRAVSNLLLRSGYNSPEKLRLLSRQLNTSTLSSVAVPLMSNNGRLKLSNLIKNARAFHLTAARQQDNDDKNRKDKDDDEESKLSLLAKAVLWMMTAYIVITVMSLVFPTSNQPEVMRYISWNEFVHHMLAKGEVEEIVIRPELDLVTIYLYEGAVLKGRKVEHKTFHMNIVDMKKFEEKLREAEQQLGIKPEKGIPVIYERNQESAWLLLFSLVAVALMILLMFRTGQIKAPPSIDIFSQLTRAKFTIVDSTTGTGKGVRFKDVAGLKEAKQEVMEFVDYLKNPDRYKNLGAKVPKGAILLGPPGCGKTLLAKAVANEAGVPFLAMAGPEFVEMIGGLGAARVRDLFKEGRKRAPCIIYIDEIDAIGRKRSSANFEGLTGEEEQTLNQLLVELDGMATKEGVIMLASTNRGEVLDKALLRPGRFDRHILIDMPNLIERKEILEQHLKPIKLQDSPGTYSHRLSQLTPGFSGADLANLCNEAALHAARSKQSVVDLYNLEYAVERVIGGTEKRTHVLSPEERKMLAYHESGHALISIVPRTSNMLGFSQYLPRDHKLHSQIELFERMCMALGGRVAESLRFNKVSTGRAENDLKKVTKLAYSQVQVYGMNEVVGLVSFPEDEEKGFGRKPFSKKLAATIDDETRRLIARAYLRTEALLKGNMDKLILIAESLLQKEVLNYSDMVQLIGEPPFGQKKLIGMLDLDSLIDSPEKPQERGKRTQEEN